MEADKRMRLLEAGEQVFVEHGFAHATVEEIATRAGVAKGTFYLYFKSKDDLVQALQRRLWEGHVQLTARAAEQLATEDWWDVVDDFLARIIDYDFEHRDWHRLVADRPTEAIAPGEEVDAQIIALVTAAIEVGVEQGVCHTDDPEMAATLLYRAVRGSSHQFCNSADVPDRDRYLAAARDLVHKALAAA